ncbi:phage integrase SAM-like domain-containing protein [uncultured Pedobacter sp.]|uniref:phage integrase SAM-like domain-containing protein n=1 Tax=uncultured Pedobacter sp. TaxID=246139 RepID=UPI0025EDCFE2|nr:phage integrase SAM-like domain-containing protein [uncultured Pedobacter sp.]
MATAKIVTWPRPNKDGQFPIGTKIWKNGKPSYIFEGYTLASRDLWDAKKQEVKKSVPNAARLTNYLRKKLSNVTDKALEMETNETAGSAKAIKAEIKPKEDNNKPIFFKDIADEYFAEHLACGDFDEFVSDRGRLKSLYIFTKDRHIAFSLYLESCFNFQSKKKKPLSETTILNHLIIIRTIYNRAITKKIASRDHYPFEKQGGIPIKPLKTAKIG